MLTDVHNQPKIVSVTSIQTPWDLSEEQNRTLQELCPLGSDLQEYTEEFNNLQEHTEEYNNLQEYTEEYNNLQEHTEEYNNLQEYTEEYNNLQEHTEEYNNLQEHTEEYNNLQEYTEEYENLQEYTEVYYNLQEHTDEYNNLQQYSEEHIDRLENTESITRKHIEVKNEILDENSSYLVIVKEEPSSDTVDIYEYDCQDDIHNSGLDINEENYNNGLLDLNIRVKKEFIDNLTAEFSLVTGNPKNNCPVGVSLSDKENRALKAYEEQEDLNKAKSAVAVKMDDPICSMSSIVKKTKIKKSKKEENEHNLSNNSNKPRTRSATTKNINYKSNVQNGKGIILKFQKCYPSIIPNSNENVKDTDKNDQNVSLSNLSKSKEHGHSIQKDNCVENYSIDDIKEFHSDTSEMESEDLLIEIPKKRKGKITNKVAKAKKTYKKKFTITKVLKSCDENCRKDEFCTQSVECRRRNRIKNDDSLRFKCTQCDYKCKTKNSLETHSLTHGGEKKFTCHLCDYRCIQKVHLDQHVRRHSSTKSYSCDYCDYTCVQRSQLDQHVRRHTKVKPFSCNICDYKCSQRCHLDQHMRRHTGVKPFSCELCDYKCTQRCHLDQHMRKHTGAKPFSCKFCKYKCIQLSQLNQHLKKKHNKIN